MNEDKKILFETYNINTLDENKRYAYTFMARRKFTWLYIFSILILAFIFGKLLELSIIFILLIEVLILSVFMTSINRSIKKKFNTNKLL